MKKQADPSRLFARWMLEQGLRSRAAAQMEIRTPAGYLIGQGPDIEATARWLAFQLGLGYQYHHLQNMMFTGNQADLFTTSLGLGRPTFLPPPGTGFLKRGVWWVWTGTQWAKGTRPERVLE